MIDMNTIRLSVIGSQCVELEVTPAALPEAEGGVTIWITGWKGTVLEEKVAYTLTADEAKQLVVAVADVITPDLLRLPDLGGRER